MVNIVMDASRTRSRNIPQYLDEVAGTSIGLLGFEHPQEESIQARSNLSDLHKCRSLSRTFFPGFCALACKHLAAKSPCHEFEP